MDWQQQSKKRAAYRPGPDAAVARAWSPWGQTSLPAPLLLRAGAYRLTLEQRQSRPWAVRGQANLAPENPNHAANLQRKRKERCFRC